MKIALGIIAVLVGFVAIVVAVGWSLPVKHRASRQASYAVPPDVVFATLTSVADFPSWRTKVKSVASVPGPDGKRGFRESGGDGDITYVVDESDPPRHLVTRIADDKLPFGGKWTYELMATGQGTTLRITEDGEVYNPLFRFVSRFVFGHQATIDTFLTDLGRKYGHPVTITD